VSAPDSPDPIVSATLAGPGQTVATLKNEVGHLGVTGLAAHITLMTPYPLFDVLMSTTNIFMMAE
jgi:hypothetical protein